MGTLAQPFGAPTTRSMVEPMLPPVDPSEWGKQSVDTAERQFLEGPRSRLAELWRALRIFGELIRGFRALHFLPPCVTVFGSARFAEDNPWYALARTTSAGLARIEIGRAHV